LNILRRPLVQIDDTEDPTIIVTPGILREGLIYSVGNYYRGDFPLWQLGPKMKRWAGTYRDRAGREFSHEVANRLSAIGWKTQVEVKVTKLLRKGFGQDFGDIDVIAWNDETGRVLLIECKDVQYRKTDGEIAEQLSDFRGQLGADGKPDLMLRHINRVRLVSAHEREVSKYINVNCKLHIEGHIVFKNVVPMKFVSTYLGLGASIHTLDEIQSI
jgi:hypothetical protein